MPHSRSLGHICKSCCLFVPQESKDRLAYLIDVFLFEPEDIDLNCEVLTWPKRIMPVFDDNDNLVEQSKQKGEKELLQKREKVFYFRFWLLSLLML